MCAGLSFHIDNLNRNEIDRFYTQEEWQKQRRGDQIQVFFWQNRPYLPVEEDGLIHLYDWGNKEQLMKLPKTGWAKIESVRDGLWDWLVPKKVIIPSLMGYEKRKWFKTPEGVSGIKIKFHNITRVYLLTQKADQKFIKLTGHDRMPIGKISYFNNK